MSYITEITYCPPTFRYSQEEMTDFYSNLTTDKQIQRKIKVLSHKSGIAFRNSILPDFSNKNTHNVLFKPENKRPSLTERMTIFKQEAIELAAGAVCKLKHFESLKSELTHIITVTCTGMYTPGLEVGLIEKLGLSTRIERHPINFMGCNAGILGLRTAHRLCEANRKAKVLVVCVELCTLHFLDQYNSDYLLSNLLFSDGAAAALIEAAPSVVPQFGALKMKKFHSLIIPEGKNEMTWITTDAAYQMHLSAAVSGLIQKNIPTVFNDLELDITSINQWAIHPGGKKILDELEHTMEFVSEELDYSRAVLNEHGNMSSVTILVVLKRMLDSNKLRLKDQVFAAAFGPGLSIESIVMNYV